VVYHYQNYKLECEKCKGTIEFWNYRDKLPELCRCKGSYYIRSGTKLEKVSHSLAGQVSAVVGQAEQTERVTSAIQPYVPQYTYTPRVTTQNPAVILQDLQDLQSEKEDEVTDNRWPNQLGG
jgi:hypothetical protein